MKKNKIAYRSRLPHLLPIGASFFVTFRLADALPRTVIRTLQETFDLKIQAIKVKKSQDYKKQIQEEKKRLFGQYDKQLDHEPYGSCALIQPEIMALIKEQLHRFDDELYELRAYCIMPNHVHILIDTAIQVTEYEMIDGEMRPFLLDNAPEEFKELFQIMKRIKGASAYYCNQFLKTTGESFWQKDSYDHYVRNEKEWSNILWYILQNPVKAALVKDWKEWNGTYLQPKIASNLFD